MSLLATLRGADKTEVDTARIVDADRCGSVVDALAAIRCYAVCGIDFFFFQAEDGIRDLTVTGVQTCALPIYGGTWHRLQSVWLKSHHRLKSVSLDDKKPDYNNCSICHVTNQNASSGTPRESDRKSVV